MAHRIRIQKFSTTILIVIIFSFNMRTCLAISEESEALSTISIIEDALEFSYTMMIEAEKAGGNVEEIVKEINTALDYVFEAKIMYSLGDFDTSIQLLKKAFEIALSSTDEAVILKSTAASSSNTQFINRIITHVITSFLIIFLFFLGWAYFKNYYSRRMSPLSPEGADHEP